MNDPKRLLESPHLPAQALSDLSLARSETSGAYDTAAGLEALMQKIEAPPASPHHSSAPPAGPGWTLATTLKTAAGIAVASTLVWLALSPNDVGLANNPDAKPGNADLATQSETAKSNGEPSSHKAQDLEAVLETEKHVAKEKLPATRKTAPSAVKAPPAKTEKTTPQSLKDSRVESETEHLVRIRRALQTAPGKALQLANAGHQTFNDGLLRQEREGLAIMALHRLGRSGEAAKRHAAFSTAYPASPLLPKLELLLNQ